MGNERIAPTPPLGWNSWDCYGMGITEQELLANARAMKQTLKPVGFEYLAGGIEDQLALEVAHGLPAARHPFFRHPVSITHLTVYLTVLEF